MPRSDRLLKLSAYRMALRFARLTSPDAVLRATPDQLVRLHQHRGEILCLIRAAHPDVLRALFAPVEPIDWSVACLTSSPGDRLLSVTRGSPGRIVETLVSLTYRVDDRDGERRAWAALVGALR